MTTTMTPTTAIDAFTLELEKEAMTTRRMLNCIPNDKFDWQPHPKSMTVRRLATHIAELPTWLGMVLTTDELDFEKNPYNPPTINSREELLEYFEACLEDGRKHLKAGAEVDLDQMWTLRSGATVYSVEPKYDVLRMSLSQIIHHRAQLGVFLRLLDVKIPGSYGPSADESF